MIRKNIQYALIFFKDRLVAGKIAEGQIEYVPRVVPQTVWLDIENIKTRSQILDESAGCISELYPEDILSMYKDNFEITYTDIKQAKMRKTPFGLGGHRSGVLKIERYEKRKKESFDIAQNQDFEKCKNIVLNALNGKLVTK